MTHSSKFSFNEFDYAQYIDEYNKIVTPIKNEYVSRSIFFSEGFMLYALTRHFDLDVIIESGIRHGGSTEIWANCFPDRKVIAMDWGKCWPPQDGVGTSKMVEEAMERLKHHKNLEFMIGDSREIIPKLIEKYKDKKVGIFIDGPKGQVALEMCGEFIQKDNVYFTAMHDEATDNTDYVFSSRNNTEFMDKVGFLNETHPQIQKYPNGPGLIALTSGIVPDPKSIDAICNSFGGTTSSTHRGTNATNWGGDKAEHGYTKIYDSYFSKIRDNNINLLEIGIFQGRGLALWSEYFSKGKIYGTDISIKEFELMKPELQSKYSAFRHNNLVNVFEGNSGDLTTFDSETIDTLPNMDIVIDDGSHRPTPQFNTLKNFWPKLNTGGYYVIEDVPHRFLDELLSLIKESDVIGNSELTHYSHPEIKLKNNAIIVIEKA